MEQKINIAELLKDAPKGTKLYSPLFGDIELISVTDVGIMVKLPKDEVGDYFTIYGQYMRMAYNNDMSDFYSPECLLFPSKDCRTWENFSAPWKHKHFEAGEKVLAAYHSQTCRKWRLAIYSHFDEDEGLHYTIDNEFYDDNGLVPYEGNEDKLGKEVE